MSQPPVYTPIPVLYDETHRGRWDQSLCIASMGQVTHLIGHLENHKPDTDGSFSICISGGEGTFISRALYESIPEEHRPHLRTENKNTIKFLIGDSHETDGTTILPFILNNNSTENKFIMKLFVHVLPELSKGMFIGTSTAPYIVLETWDAGRKAYDFDLNGQVVRVVGE